MICRITATQAHICFHALLLYVHTWKPCPVSRLSHSLVLGLLVFCLHRSSLQEIISQGWPLTKRILPHLICLYSGFDCCIVVFVSILHPGFEKYHQPKSNTLMDVKPWPLTPRFWQHTRPSLARSIACFLKSSRKHNVRRWSMEKLSVRVFQLCLSVYATLAFLKWKCSSVFYIDFHSGWVALAKALGWTGLFWLTFTLIS